MPFPPSHAEIVTAEGTSIGEFGFGGMQERDYGYDRNEVEVLSDGRRAEILVCLPVTQQQHDTFYAKARESIGQGYDWWAIPGFLLSGHHHEVGKAFCSAKVFLLLRAVNYFKWPIVVPAHLVTPRDLMMMLSLFVEIPH